MLDGLNELRVSRLDARRSGFSVIRLHLLRALAMRSEDDRQDYIIQDQCRQCALIVAHTQWPLFNFASELERRSAS